ncbi:Uncharacterized protein APZ42_027752 [Daphnia magna]|uniref:Uncharacterized protein n=1 Tax=Daphnia magna TaxID=35525 RepID=A0A164R2R1_9CRUS|nr:Uncharacterized protein APZ42_027752 [Daphnia magna]
MISSIINLVCNSFEMFFPKNKKYLCPNMIILEKISKNRRIIKRNFCYLPYHNTKKIPTGKDYVQLSNLGVGLKEVSVFIDATAKELRDDFPTFIWTLICLWQIILQHCACYFVTGYILGNGLCSMPGQKWKSTILCDEYFFTYHKDGVNTQELKGEYKCKFQLIAQPNGNYRHAGLKHNHGHHEAELKNVTLLAEAFWRALLEGRLTRYVFEDVRAEIPGANVGYNQKVQRAMMQRAQRRAESSNPAFVAEATAMLAANDRYRKALGTDIFLIAYVMMTGKVESLYDLVFAQIVRKLNTLIPGDNTSVRLMVSDFEFAIINSSKRGRDSCSTRKSQGSWFHFGQGCSEGLQVAYARPNEQNIVKLLIPIALLPSKSALEGFELIRTNSVALLEAEGEVVKEAFPRIFEYFQNYWTVIVI